MDENTQTGGNELDVDALLAAHEAPTPERAMGDEPTQAAPAPQAPTPQQIQELEFTVGGKQIKVPYGDPKLQQWAQQGYDYSQRIQQFNQERSQIEKQVQEYQNRIKPFMEIEEYAKQNPQWFQHWKQAYEQKEAALGQNPMAQELMALKQEMLKELEPIKNHFTQQQEQQIAQQRQVEDKQLSDEMDSIRKQYADLDFNSKDTDGKSLEYKVLEFANQKKINDYKTAFLAFNHDSLVKLASEKARESLVRETQTNKKQGLLGKTSTPTKQLSDVRDVKSKSYEHILDEIKAEYGIG